MGNLDFLWYMLNQLSKLDTQIESNLKKMDRQVKDLDAQHADFVIDTREDGKSKLKRVHFHNVISCGLSHIKNI